MVITTSRPDRTNSIRRRFAKAVCAKLRLPVDDVLSHVIGSGKESTSEAAVVTWLLRSGIDPLKTSLHDACDTLQRDLSDRLDA